MEADDLAGGIALALFDGVDDFCKSITTGTATDDDRRVHGDHPLISIVENVLEPWSANHLNDMVVGMTKSSMRHLEQHRMSLEGPPSVEPAKQRLLYSFGVVIEIFRDSSYGQASVEDSATFFEDAFPVWLGHLEEWAREASITELETRVAEARSRYSDVAGDVTSFGASSIGHGPQDE